MKMVNEPTNNNINYSEEVFEKESMDEFNGEFVKVDDLQLEDVEVSENDPQLSDFLLSENDQELRDVFLSEDDPEINSFKDLEDM
ncbi:MAG: hypothetical protein AAGU01_01180 [Clostridiaceae bacterium]